MNSPLVVEQAKHLVALPEFSACKDDDARVDFLYRRVYQRSPRSEEIKLGLEFVGESPAPERAFKSQADLRQVSNEEPKFRPRPFGKGQARRQGGPERRRNPLTAWEEYAHALLQATKPRS